MSQHDRYRSSRQSLFDPDAMRRKRLANRRLRSAQISLYLETILKFIWRPLSWIALFFALMLLSVPDLIGNAGWILTGITFWVGLFVILAKDIKTLKIPTKTDILKRSEQDNDLPYRPIEILNDTPAGIHSIAKKKLWTKIAERAEKDIKALKPSYPVLSSARWDQKGVRIMALIALMAGFIIAGHDSNDRLLRGLFPFGGLGSNTGLEYTIWVTAPDYTGYRDIVIDSENKDISYPEITLAEGSEIKATINGLWGPAWFSLSHEYDELSLRFSATEHDSTIIDATIKDMNIPEGHSLAQIELGEVEAQAGAQTATIDTRVKAELKLQNLIRSFARYDVLYAADESPTISWAESGQFSGTKTDAIESDALENDNEAENTNGDSESETSETAPQTPDPFEELIAKTDDGHDRNYGMSFPITMYDDYGVKSIELHLSLAEDMTDKPLIDGQNVYTKPISTSARQDYATSSYFDLSDHPWVGLPVEVSIHAIDAAGQHAQTDKRVYTLREREFSQILAQRLVYLRKKLIWNGLEEAQRVAFDLTYQLDYPEDMRDDPAIWLQIRKTRDNLKRADDIEDIKKTIDDLWTIALDLEDMGLSKAARQLDRATSRLTRALRRDRTSDEDKFSLFKEYKESMKNYLDKLREFNENRDGIEGQITPDIMNDLMDPEPLEEMLNQMEDLAQAEDYESLEDMIANLQALLDSFARGGAMPPDLEAMEMGLNVLQGLIDNQKALLSETDELAQLVPDSAKFPQKGFGEEIPVPEDLIENWNAGEMPPAPTERDFKSHEQSDDNHPKFLPDGRPAPPMGMPSIEVPDDALTRQNPVIDDSLPDTEQQGDIQEVLRFVLGELMGELYDYTGKIPETMPLAELEMRNSTRELDKRRPDESVPIQEEVIRLLEQAQQDLQEQMQDQMEKRAGMQLGPQNMDPLGRPTGPDEDNLFSDDSDIEVPDSFERRRIDEILEYLRKHAGDPERSELEKEYFRRLLRSFN